MITSIYNVHLTPLNDIEGQIYYSPFQLPPTPDEALPTRDILSMHFNVYSGVREKDMRVKSLTKKGCFIPRI